MQWSHEVKEHIKDVFGEGLFLEMARRGDTRLPALVEDVLVLANRLDFLSCESGHVEVGPAGGTVLSSALSTVHEWRTTLVVLTAQLRTDRAYVEHMVAEHEESMTRDASGYGID